MNLGENIYRFRTRQNMSQGDLADALDVSRQSVSKWENNNAVPELEKLIRMSQLFGITLDELVAGEVSESPAVQEADIRPEVPPHTSGFSARKLTGVLLLVCGVLCFFVPTLLGGFLFGYLFGAPLIVIGAVLAFSEQDWLFRICWLLFAALCPMMSIFGYNFIRFDIHNVFSVIFLTVLIVLILWTVLGFRRGKLSPASKKFVAFSIAILIAASLVFSALLLPHSYTNEFHTTATETFPIEE